MDIKQVSKIMTAVYSDLKPTDVVVSKRDDTFVIRVVSNSFDKMSFADRFKTMSDLLLKNHPEMFEKDLYVFEAFTASEAISLPAKEVGDTENDLDDSQFRESAKDLEQQ